MAKVGRNEIIRASRKACPFVMVNVLLNISPKIVEGGMFFYLPIFKKLNRKIRMNVKKIYSLITIGGIAICIILYRNGDLVLKDIGTAVLALFGTFLVATLAFRLNEQKEKIDEKKKQREALNRALFVLMRQHNAIIQLKRDMDTYSSELHLAL